MKRKLVKQGNGALTISLPHKWIELNNLEKGDYIDLLESGKDLLATSSGKMEVKRHEITISLEKPFFKRYLKSLYILGYDNIMINSLDKLPISEIKKSIRELIGFEIIDQTQKRCEVSIVSTSNSDSLDSLLRRVFHIISNMMEDIISQLRLKEIEELKSIAEREENVNRFVNLCLRSLNKQGYHDYKKTPYIYLILSNLELIADALRDFCLDVKVPNQDVADLLSEIKIYFDECHKLFFKYDMKKIKNVKEQRIKLFSLAYSVNASMPDQVMYLYHIIATLHQIEVAFDPLNS